MRSRLLAMAVVVPALVAPLAGCGESAVDSYVKTAPATVDQDMRDALNAMTSVHVHTVQTTGNTPFTMDISVDNAGHCVGTLSQGTEVLKLIGISPTEVYANASADFWKNEESASSTAAAALADKWVSGLPKEMFANTCDIKSLVNSFTGNTVDKDAPKVTGKTKVEGMDAVNLEITMSGTTVTIAVAATKPHRPLSVNAAGGKLTSLFTQFDQPVKPTAPVGAQDLNKLKAGQ